jgi:hypothetical protein
VGYAGRTVLEEVKKKKKTQFMGNGIGAAKN